MDKSKVSIIMPCYNGADTIERAIRGILTQTYRPIELILVNDGSTDSTEAIIFSLTQEIQNAKIDFRYFPQANTGLGGAINSGLKHVTGGYLAWADADDELLPDSVRVRVDFLKNHPEYGSVSSNAILAEDANWSQSLGLLTDNVKINSDENQFIHMLLGRSLFCPGCHLVRTEVFRAANRGMDIYPARHGQNWQMLLPVYYCSKHAFINQPLYKYRVNADNMSAEIDRMSLKQLYKRREEYIQIVRHTLSRIHGMPPAECRKYFNMFKKHIYEINLDSALEEQKRIDILRWKIAVKYMIALTTHLF